jgi:DnaJ-class molecular chaperone
MNEQANGRVFSKYGIDKKNSTFSEIREAYITVRIKYHKSFTQKKRLSVNHFLDMKSQYENLVDH